MTGGKNGSYWVGHVQNNVSWDFSNSLMFPVNGQCIPPRGPNPAASRPSMNVYTCVMFPFGFQHLRVQIWTNQMASSVLKPAASSVFYLQCWLVGCESPTLLSNEPSGSRESKSDGGKKAGSVFVEAWRRRAPSPWTVLSVSLSVMRALMSSGKGSSSRWRCAAKSGCFVFDLNLPEKPRKGSESHTMALFKAIPGWTSCLNRVVLWWATEVADATPKRKPLVQKPLIGHDTQQPWPLTSADPL